MKSILPPFHELAPFFAKSSTIDKFPEELASQSANIDFCFNCKFAFILFNFYTSIPIISSF